MPGSVGDTGLAGNHAVKCCRTVLSNFEVIRLKIRLNFMAARNVPVPLAQKTRWTDDSPLPKSRGCFCVIPIHTEEEPPIPCATRNWRFFL